MAPRSLVASWKNGNVVAVLVLLVITLFLIGHRAIQSVSILHENNYVKWQPSSKFQLESRAEETKFSNPISSSLPKRLVIGAVSCRNIRDLETNKTVEEQMKYSEETFVMLKSVLISAKLYGIAVVELHLFLENVEEDSKYFQHKLEGISFPNGDVVLDLHIHDAVSFVPERHRDHMIYHPRYRCGYVRFLFPSALPNVDSIIHLDSDMIITGNIWKIWETLYEFEGEQVIGAARSNEEHDTYYLEMTKNWFGDIPHPGPRGLNAGLLVMNLTKMREYNWDQKFIKTYEDYSKIVKLTGQRTVNILLGYDTGILKMMSCKLNFCHRHCDRGFTCLDAEQDPIGIHLVHGNGFKMERGQVFHSIFVGYKDFNMSLMSEEQNVSRLEYKLREHLMTPIRQEYVQEDSTNKCYGLLNSLLFKSYYPENDK